MRASRRCCASSTTNPASSAASAYSAPGTRQSAPANLQTGSRAITIYAYEAQESWLPTVIGLTCSAVELDNDATLLLHFGDTQPAPDGRLEADRTIAMAGVWRVERDGEVRAASGDADDPVGRDNLDPLVGQPLQRVEVGRPGFDLVLYLGDEHVVRCFPCDSREFAEELEDGETAFASWWVDGVGVPDDWEEPNEAFFTESEA